MKTYYDILEISRYASQEVLEKSYKVLIKKYHPDLVKNEEDKKKNEEKLKKITHAYEILSDPAKRRAYDFDTFGKFNNEEDFNKQKFNEDKTNESIVDDRKKEEEEINERIRQAQERINKEENEIKQRLYKYEEDYLKSMGYTIKKPIDWRQVGVFVLTIIVFIIICIIIYFIPPVRQYVDDQITSETPVGMLFKILKEIIAAIIKLIIGIFKR